MFATEDVALASGRRVRVHLIAGAPGARTVVFCHGAPGSGGFDPDPDATAARGVTLIGIDRPGYGGSDPMPADAWASVDRAADDVAEVLDQMGTGPVGLVGWSAGGRVALAVAARRPDLVSRLAVIATPAPDEHVPWIPPERAALDLLRDRPPAMAREVLASQLAGLVPTPTALASETLALAGAGEADNAALAMPGARERVIEMLRAAFDQGTAGLAADIAGYCLRPWGFDIGDVRAKTLVLNGAHDPIAGPRHGKWWQRHLADARYEQSPNAGHLLVVPTWARVMSFLAPRSGSA